MGRWTAPLRRLLTLAHPARCYGVRVRTALLALTCAACLVACGTKPDAGAPREKLTIAYATIFYAALAQIALVKGYFAEEGLDVTPRLFPYGKVALEQMLKGDADFATVAETPALFAILGGAPLSIIATILTSNNDHAIVARKDRGIVSVANLKGRRIAVAPGTTSQFFMDALLAINGMARKEVTAVGMNIEDMPLALARGTVDAGALFYPYVLHAQQQLGDKGTTFYAADLYTITFNIVGKPEFVRKNPATVAKLLRALIRAEEFAAADPQEAQAIVAEFCRMDVEVVRRVWVDAVLRVVLEQRLILAMEDETRWAMNAGLAPVSEVPNLLDYIHVDALKSVRPQAVRILR
jgi:NitT/TauT family transport system substrate-binding protein